MRSFELMHEPCLRSKIIIGSIYEITSKREITIKCLLHSIKFYCLAIINMVEASTTKFNNTKKKCNLDDQWERSQWVIIVIADRLFRLLFGNQHHPISIIIRFFFHRENISRLLAVIMSIKNCWTINFNINLITK